MSMSAENKTNCDQKQKRTEKSILHDIDFNPLKTTNKLHKLFIYNALKIMLS